ncbi:hypothetical protein D6774_00555 [Candidatus Woesearchaeota archaeon]|nr:MAG: hypothetical protein D6774_00555 [Candidatus Woesearchaeota archaeon]
MNPREPHTHQYIAAFAIATLLFFSGLWFGSYLSDQKLESIGDLENDIRLSTLGSELQYQILEQEPCAASNSTALIKELFEIGSRLDFMESQRGPKDPQVIELKEFYHLLEIRHWLLMRQVKEQCSTNTDLILYFYSNEGDCDKCSEQGTILTYLHRTRPDISIYSFDINIDNPALTALKELFKVRSTPTLIVNDKKFESFTSLEELQSQLS